MRIISSKETLKTRVFRVTDTIARDAGGFEIHRSIVSHEGSAVVLPVDEDGRVLLVRQYRVPAEKTLWELTAGRLDPGEKPLAAARRELAEETGLRARHWKRLARFYPTPGYVSELMHLYLASGLKQGEACTEEDERIETRWFTRGELEQWVDSGKLEDAKTLAGLLLYWRMRGK
ncbi:MAG: NUDIX hydrolase [Bryobacterales bacterium]|nr:NUDIX hydrolase [Bryobacterales bacterium]